MPTLLDVLPESPESAPPPVVAASQPGLLRDKVVEILGLLLDAPERANPQLRRLFRRERTLGSRDRRLAKDSIVCVLRHRPFLLHVLEEGGWGGDREALALWLGALCLSQGLSPELAAAGFGAPCFDALRDPREALGRWLDGAPTATALARAGSLPEPVAAALLERYGEAEAVDFLVASNRRAPIALRVNAARTDREALLRELDEEGISGTPMRWARCGVVALGPANLIATRAFKRGGFELQDEGSQLIAELVSPPRQGLIVDLCAGAGGKSLAIAAELPRGARVLAMDVRASALEQGRRRAKRAGVADRVSFEHVEVDGQVPVGEGEAARVLIDAPCSGSGTLRRSPAIRWRLDARRLAELRALQARLLRKGAALVRPGGRLIYATCSVLPQENELQVQAFLEANESWVQIPVKEVLGAARAEGVSEGDALVTLPHRHDCDGFFAAILQRER